MMELELQEDAEHTTAREQIRAKVDSNRIRTHFKVMQYVMEAAVKLQLQSVTSAAACTIYHR